MSLRWQLARLYSRITPTNRGSYAVARWARKEIPPAAWRGSFQVSSKLTFELDLSTYPDCSMALGLYEIETCRLLDRLLKPGGYFVDGGANLGYFTLRAWCRIGNMGRIDAFEPDAINRARLERHLRQNGAQGVHVHPWAISSEAGEIDFYHPAGELNHGQASAYADLVPQGDRSQVRAVLLDDMCDRVPDVIKLDVEGAELPALKGALRLLQSTPPPTLIIEHNHQSSAAAGYRPSDLFRFLKTAQPSYRLYWIGWPLTEIRTPEDLDAISRQGNILVSSNPQLSK